MALLLLAGLQVIPDDVYDAAKVDGATTWQRFRRIDPAVGARDPRGTDLPHARRAADLRPALRAHRWVERHDDLVADRAPELTANRLIGYGSALSVLTFIIVMAVSFIYIRTVGGNIRSLAEEG